MRILLLNPPAKNFYGELGIRLMPLGIAYLAAVLQNDGHAVSAFDLQVEPEAASTIDFENYDLVGISSDTPRFNAAVNIGQKARKSGLPVVFGGYHATFLDEEPLERGAADFVVRGEGEYALSELVQKLEHGDDAFEDISGLTWRVNGNIHRNKITPVIEDLDALPFPSRNLFPEHRYLHTYNDQKMATVLTSRGCPFDCYFCAASRFAGKRWRTRSLDSIMQELYTLIQQGYGAFISWMIILHWTLNESMPFAKKF